MKLWIGSDTHNEFSELALRTSDFAEAEAIVLAGDIGKVATGIHWARRTFPRRPIVQIAGNHELYGTQRLETMAKMRLAAKESRVDFLDDEEVIFDGEHESTRFLGATLWTDFKLYGEQTKKMAMHEGQQCLNDFRCIHEGSRGHFSPQHSIDLHEKSLEWLTSKLDEPFDGKTVVVTHHLPSMLSVSDRFKDSLLSACFASNLDHLFGKMDLWIHGHTHDNKDYVCNGTRVICNPRGYVTYQGTENFEFNPAMIIEV